MNSIHEPDPIVSTMTVELDLMNPKPNDIHLTEMAVSLARKGRYTDLSERPVTVLQHLALCNELAEEAGIDRMDVRLLIMLHDAHEAYTGDIARPLKKLVGRHAPGLIEGIEGRLDAAILESLGLPGQMAQGGHPLRSIVKRIDNLALAHEVTYAFPQVLDRWSFLPDIDTAFHHDVAIPIMQAQPGFVFNSFLAELQRLCDAYHKVTSNFVGTA